MIEEKYWQAILAKDIHTQGPFIYGVRSTGIYCKPTCPSRRPAREQIVLFPSAAAAEQAGFRECKRCRPRGADDEEQRVELVQQVCAYIEAHLDEAVTLNALGEQVGMSPYHLQRVFKQVMGISPRRYAEAYRLKQLKARLKDGEAVTAALYDVGYGSSSRLYEHAPAQLGMTPARYRRGGHGMHISYTIVDSPLGRLLVAATEKGVSSVCLGDDDEMLEAALRDEYPAAEIERDGEDLTEQVNAILNHLRGQQPHLDLPIDVQATAFQWRVWQELLMIPYGETRSYGEIARALGDARAARAVAQACATNPVAIVIPCHRVVRNDGISGGYRWGAERKHRLLAQEQEQAQAALHP
jgi:AraC family transcriptional regulator of adaptative response/methylated-DNA-[protein]-cysteine methyltransferase